jgi:hypothetical protein
MSLRKQIINFGILFKNDVLYSSDSCIRSVLDLARFSIAFASNLVRDSQLVEITHEPTLMSELKNLLAQKGKQLLISREHVLFKFFTNSGGDTIAICTTYPSSDDLKSLGIADLTMDQLAAQSRIFMETLGKRFTEVVDVDSITQLRPDLQDFESVSERLELNKIMSLLYDEAVQASQVIFQDDHARLDKDEASRPKKTCTLLFTSVMNGSLPVASRFFRKLEGLFKVNLDALSDSGAVIENLISAQMSTIVTSSISIAKTMIRQVEIKVAGDMQEETLYITFFPIKNEFSLVMMAIGDPTTLRFLTEATARTLEGVDVLDERFTGNLEGFEVVNNILHSIPSVNDARDMTLDDAEIFTEADLTADLDASEGTGPSSLQFAKMIILQSQINSAIHRLDIAEASKLTKLLCLLSLKVGNKFLATYCQIKFDALTARSKAS